MTLKKACDLVIKHLKDQVARYIEDARDCFSLLRKHLEMKQNDYSPQIGESWLRSSYTGNVAYEKSIALLSRVYSNNNIEESTGEIIARAKRYEVIAAFINELRPSFAYASSTLEKYERCSKIFSVYLQDYQLLFEIKNIKYEHIFNFYNSQTFKKYRRSGMPEFVARFIEFLHKRSIVPFAYVLTIRYYSYEHGCYWNHIDAKLEEAIKRQISSPDEGLPLSEYLSHVNVILNVLKDNNYAKNSVSAYRKAYELFYIFMDINSLTYEREISLLWYSCNADFIGNKHYALRALDVLDSHVTNGTIDLHQVYIRRQNCTDKLSEWCKPVVLKFMELKKKENWTSSTLSSYRIAISVFCNYLDDQGIHSFSDITPEVIKSFNLADKHRTIAGKNSYISKIKKFLHYLFEAGYTPNRQIEFALQSSHAVRETFVNILTKEERDQLYREISADSCSFLTRAIILIGLEMGVRASDIVDLRLDNIDFEHVSFKFVQKKTGKEVELPIPVDVANAIYQYLIHERPETNSCYLFVQKRAPYGKYSTTKPLRLLNELMPDLQKGFHVTRKTFASLLLQNGASVEDISFALGHEGILSVHRYLALDHERMKGCSISLQEEGLIHNGDFKTKHKI